MTKKDALKLYASFAHDVERACDATSADRLYRELVSVIREQEKQHLAFGRRLVGNVKRAITRDQTVAYFVTQTIVRALDHFARAQGGDAAHVKATLAHALTIRDDYRLALAIVYQATNVNGDPSSNEYRTHDALLDRMQKAAGYPGLYAALDEWGYDTLVKGGN